MDAKWILRGNRVTRMVFFLGFVGLIGWLGTSWYLFQFSKINQTWDLPGLTVASFTLTQSAALFAHALRQCCFFLLLILPSILVVRSRLRPCLQDRSLWIRPLVAAIFLSPLYVLLGALLILFSPGK